MTINTWHPTACFSHSHLLEPLTDHSATTDESIRLQFAPGPDLEFTHLSRRFEQRFGFLATLSRPAPP